MIPSVEECFQLMKQYEMLENIKAHSVVVTRIAELIGRRMRDAGLNISMDIVIAGALLHDISTTTRPNNGKRHDLKGKKVCLDHGFVEIADIVGEHVVLKSGLSYEGVTEKELVYYSDKRVNHDSIVSLHERKSYILKRYGRGNQQLHKLIRRNFKICQSLEENVFDYLDFRPDDLADMLRQSSSSVLDAIPQNPDT